MLLLTAAYKYTICQFGGYFLFFIEGESCSL